MMKKMLLFAAAALFAVSAPALAAEKTMHGSISDSMCGAHHGGDMHAGQKVDAAACTKKCVDGGAKYVFVAVLPYLDLKSMYGPFYVSVGLLIWAYMSGLILFAGAQFSVARLGNKKI